MPMSWDVSNEELAIAAKDGDVGARDQLWEQTYRLAFKIAIKHKDFVARYGHDVDDLKQVSYFAFVYAIERFTPSKGFLFNSYLRRAILHALYGLLGYRGYIKNNLPISHYRPL